MLPRSPFDFSITSIVLEQMHTIGGLGFFFLHPHFLLGVMMITHTIIIAHVDQRKALVEHSKKSEHVCVGKIGFFSIGSLLDNSPIYVVGCIIQQKRPYLIVYHDSKINQHFFFHKKRGVFHF